MEWARVAAIAVAASALLAVGLGRRDLEHERWQATLPHPRRDGFMTSDRCQSCHPDQHASWFRSYHRTMTQAATPEAVRAPMEVTMTSEGQSWRLWRAGDQFLVETAGHRRRVGLVTGSHHMQTFWAADEGAGNLQSWIPLTYLLDERRWIPRRDAFLMPPDADWQPQVWNGNCIECHAVAGRPRLHDDRADTEVAELGIACEACHGPGEAHVTANGNPLRRYQLHFSGGRDDTIVNPARLSGAAATAVCGQCHGIKCRPPDWTQNGMSLRPGDPVPLVERKSHGCGDPDEAFWRARYWSDGMVRVSGREANAIVRSPCYRGGRFSCLSCHSMHAGAPENQLRPGEDGCGHCHTVGPEHTHHAAASPGSRCVNCHMPYTTYGLLKAIRSHQIDSPAVASSLETGRPNACNLCHLDRSLAWTAQKLSAWYGLAPPPLLPEDESTPAAVGWLLRGDAGQRALAAWSMGWEPALVAAGRDWQASLLQALAGDRYAAVRTIAARSLRRVGGTRTLISADEVRRLQAQRDDRPLYLAE